MGSVNLKLLVSKLNDTCRRSLEGAAGLALSREHYNVEVEHWLLKLLEMPNTDLAAILMSFGLMLAPIAAGLAAPAKVGSVVHIFLTAWYRWLTN